MAESTVVSLSEARKQRDLLSSELSLGIGCIGCRNEFTGHYVVTADRDARKALTEDMITASELTGVPVDIRASSRVYAQGLLPTEECGLDRPCAQPGVREIFQDILASL